jgi:hypothetical protein
MSSKQQQQQQQQTSWYISDFQVSRQHTGWDQTAACRQQLDFTSQNRFRYVCRLL